MSINLTTYAKSNPKELKVAHHIICYRSTLNLEGTSPTGYLIPETGELPALRPRKAVGNF